MDRKRNLTKINSEIVAFKRAVADVGLDAKFFVYGSWAKGRESDWSDIDVCVVSSEFGNDYWAEERKINRIANDVDYRIEPVVMKPKDLLDKYSTLASEIRKWGIEV